MLILPKLTNSKSAMSEGKQLELSKSKLESNLFRLSISFVFVAFGGFICLMFFRAARLFSIVILYLSSIVFSIFLLFLMNILRGFSKNFWLKFVFVLSFFICAIYAILFFWNAGGRFFFFFRGEDHKNTTQTESFEKMISLHPEWKKENGGFVVVPPDGFIYRVQKFGSCYIHAPIAELYYISSRSITNPKVVDMVSLVRESFTFQRLFGYFFMDSGGSASAVLGSLLKDPLDMQISKNYTDDLIKFGSLLVSMKIYDDLYKSSNFSHAYVRNGSQVVNNVHGYHSMVIIGFRFDVKSGMTFFLAQNWWMGMQFLEVSDKYLDACMAEVICVKVAQDVPVNKFKTTDHRFTRAINLDRQCKLPRMHDNWRKPRMSG